MSRLLLLSNSTMPGTSFFSWPKAHVQDFLGSGVKQVAFIPFAAVTLPFDTYAKLVSQAFESLGYEVRSVHDARDKAAIIEQAHAVVVGGGNTFALLSRMYTEELLDVVRAKVADGTPYIGWSAGANLACPTLMTTNDMPVVSPPSFDSLRLIPFQLNPHYHELKFPNQGGETRRERLEEFVAMNPRTKVVGLPEGMLMRREGGRLQLVGEGTARLYESGMDIVDLRGGTDVTFLLA